MFLASGSRIGLPFVMEYRREKANGGTEVKMSKRRTLVYPSYCPFCGEKTEDVC
jgi:hypothetical protein